MHATINYYKLSSTSLATFKRSHKTHLFQQCFLRSVRQTIVTLYSALEVTLHVLFTALYKLTIFTLHYITKLLTEEMFRTLRGANTKASTVRIVKQQ